MADNEMNENPLSPQMPEAGDAPWTDEAPEMTGFESPEERGERIGEGIEWAYETEAAWEATPEARKADGKKHVGIIVAIVAFVVLLVGAGAAYSLLAPAADEPVEVTSTDVVHSSTVETTDTGEGEEDTTMPAPDFTMNTDTGSPIKFSNLKGKPTVLNFWASWCGPCKSEMPEFQSAYEQFGEDVQFVMVNMTGMSGETESSAKALISSEGYTFPVYFDVDNSAAKAYGVTSIPQTYLIDENGDIIGFYSGALNGTILSQGIDMLLTSR